ncbi:MAG: protein kinase [Burkholderiaceae bacterium]|jgi:serine/threonine-protein kinase|nr:protein kinase [Burkholderiaceae bacterium]
MNAPALATLPTEPAAILPAPPRTIGRFQVRDEIGRGSNGVVYSAHDPVLGREVAIKAVPLTESPQYRQQVEAGFLNEARAAGRLNHPHIVTIFDAGKSGDLAYIAMERLHGRDLHDVLAAGQQMPLRQVASLMARVADAVHYAHKRGLIHRDIKPSNIFLLRDGKPKVLDFGVALTMVGDVNSTQRRQLIGTPNYMSPEQALGRTIDGRSDIFSIGSILYELIGGKRAFDGVSIEETLAQVIADTPTPLEQLRPDVPPPLLAVVRRALSKDIEQRYQSAGELRNDLAAYAGGATVALAARGPATRGRALQRRLKTPQARLALAGVAAVAAFGLAVLLSRETPPAPPAVVATAPSSSVELRPAPLRPATAPAANPTSPPSDTPSAKSIAPDSRSTSPAPAARSTEPRRTRSETTAAAPPTGDGYVALAVSPWGEVVVNGATRGVSPPLTRLQLPPGVHAVEIRNGAAPPLKARVEVKPGQTIALQHRF